MARYIDADKLCEALKSMASVQYPDKQNTILGVVSSIENFPTADVVPKSEVVKEFTRRFEMYIGNCTFTLGQTNDIQYALKKATEDMIGGK